MRETNPVETHSTHKRGKKMTITVQIKSNYGNKAIYPACDTSKKLADLIGHKTFTDQSIAKIKALGYTINVQQQTV